MMIQLPQRLMPNYCNLENQRELTLLALCIWGEARGESEEGKAAVAHVVMNRYRAQTRYGLTIRDVILKPKQFSFFNDRKTISLNIMTMAQNQSWESCVYAAWEAYLGISADPTGGATHYHNQKCSPVWIQDVTKTKVIGNHIFYR